MEAHLPVIWAGIIGLAVAMYVILDGFDLGIGILTPFAETDAARDQMINSVAPFWDGNETWLVMGGVGLLVAFPMAYAVIMPAFYLPVILMLLALVFRGVAFEFRIVSRSKTLWNIAFAGGSTVAAFCQGLILGGMIQGIRVENNQYAGGSFDWATPFAALCGIGVTTGYALLGATWLVMKTEGPVADRARVQARTLLFAVLGAMGMVSLWTPWLFSSIATRWFTLPNFYYLAPIPILTALIAFGTWRSLSGERTALPFFSSIGLFLLGFLGLVVSWFPYLVPPSLTIWDTAAAPSSQMFILVGAMVLLPLILAYTIGIYWLFRGKTKPGDSYHPH
jgi:cytochrome bd ubiquinol oxidase subunit II